MAGLIGIFMAAATVFAAGRVGLARERGFYPTILIVIAGYYILFAVMAGTPHVLLSEAGWFLGFSALAIAAFRRHPRLVALGLIAHGVFDVLHAHLVDNAAVPPWWPSFCLAYDALLGGWLLLGGRAGGAIDEGLQDRDERHFTTMKTSRHDCQ